MGRWIENQYEKLMETSFLQFVLLSITKLIEFIIKRK